MGQTCQLSRICRVTHEFEHHLTVSRKYCQISGMYNFVILDANFNNFLTLHGCETKR